MITLQKLEVFIHVCEQGSLNRAAKVMRLSQSAVSQHIQDIEATLGTQVLVRSPQGTQPTAEGRILLDYARQVQRLLDEMEQKIGRTERRINRQISLSATPGVSVYLLPGWLRRFQQAYGNVNVSMQTGSTRQVISGVLNKRDAFGLVEGSIEELAGDEIGQITLMQIEYDIIVSATHSWAGRSQVDAADLASQSFITRQPGSRTRQWLEGVLHRHNVRLKNSTELDSPGTIKYALLKRRWRVDSATLCGRARDRAQRTGGAASE